MTLETLFELAEVENRAMQLPVIPLDGFVKAQRKLGIPTSNERESEMIKQGAYPFAEAVQLTDWRYIIYAVPYLRWINERIRDSAV